MHNRLRWGAGLAASAALAAAGGAARAQDAAGDWHGTLTSPAGMMLRVGLTLKAKAGGGYEGRFVSPEKRFALQNIKLDHGRLSFSSGSGNYSGRWDERRKAWVGQWIFPMTFIVPRGAAQPTSLPPIPTSPLVLTGGKQ
jgi:hypothetical protein